MADVRGTRIQRMLADPELTRILLAIGVSISARLDFGGPWPMKLSDIATDVYGPPPDPPPGPIDPETGELAIRFRPGPHWHTVANDLAKDARTYRPPSSNGLRCTAPMIRRKGECGARTSTYCQLTDWATGLRYPLGACNRHRDWFESTHRAHRAAKPDIVPLPPANHGGVLARHFPEIDWPAVWRNVDPRWKPHPEPVPWPKPTLTLLVGDDTPAVPSQRPALALVPDPTPIGV